MQTLSVREPEPEPVQVRAREPVLVLQIQVRVQVPEQVLQVQELLQRALPLREPAARVMRRRFRIRRKISEDP
jgi:hypothetical protein